MEGAVLEVRELRVELLSPDGATTVRQVLSHQAGVPVFPGDVLVGDELPELVRARAVRVERIKLSIFSSLLTKPLAVIIPFVTVPLFSTCNPFTAPGQSVTSSVLSIRSQYRTIERSERFFILLMERNFLSNVRIV